MKRIAIIFLCIVAVAGAATTITFNINNTYGAKLLAAFTAQDNSHVSIRFRGSQNAEDPNVPDYSAKIDINPNKMIRLPGDTNAQYVKRRVGLIIDAVRLAHEKKLEADARAEAIAAVPAISVFDPNGIEE